MSSPPPHQATQPEDMINIPATTMDTSQATNPVMMDPPPSSLPSAVDETLSRCPRFRVLVVGNTGVGKSSLIANIFGFSQQDIDITHDHAGRADIDREYTSDDNPCFALHDSKGFEPGITDHWGTVENFIRQRSKKSLPVEQRLHALWLCIETPRSGMRLMQTADEKLVKLALARRIPVIVVFTKFDLLYAEFFARMARNHSQQDNCIIDHDQILEEAKIPLKKSIKEFRQQFYLPKRRRFSWPKTNQVMSCVAISTNPTLPGFLRTLEELTEVTRKCLHTKETFIPWAVAQRIDPKQKVQASIQEGSKKYWKNLAKSTVFKGHALKDCLWRIHLDIVKVWNFRDPQMLLVTTQFHVQMLSLIESFVPHSQSDLHLGSTAALTGILSLMMPHFAIFFGAAGFSAVTIRYLCSNYRAVPETALYLEAYIINLALFLHELFVTALQTEWQRPLNGEILATTLEHFRGCKSQQIHQLIRGNAPATRDAIAAERRRRIIGDLICGHFRTCVGMTKFESY